MKCKYCGKEMWLDDVDFNFKGNKDNYWICREFYATAIEKIRFNRTVSVKFEKEEQKNA